MGTTVGGSLSISGARGLDIGERAILGERCRIDVHLSEVGLARIAVGAGTILGPRNHLGAASSVEIGSGVLTAEGVTILDHDHDFSDPEDPRRRNRTVIAAPVRIEDRVFLGERVVVLKGVTIGRCAVVGAHAVVTHDLPPYSMCVGAPARPIAFWDKELRAWRKA